MRPFCQLKTGSKGSEETPLLLSGFYLLLRHYWRDCCMPAETMSYDSIKEILYEGIRYGQTHFSEDSHYLCFIGYMLAAPPAWYLFDASTLPSGIDPVF